MKKIGLFLVSFIFLFPVALLAQTVGNVEPKVLGIPLGDIAYVIAILWGAAITYYQRNQKQITTEINNYIQKNVKNTLLERAIKFLADKALDAVTLTDNDLYKNFKAATADHKLTIDEIKQLKVYAEAKLRNMVPTAIQETLKEHNIWDNSDYLSGLIEVAVNELKTKKAIANITK
jgi:hypothetical protein